MTPDTTIDDYLRRPYARLLVPDAESGTYTAEVAEFPGCVAQGDTPAEAYAALDEAAREWLDAAIESGKPVPDPLAENEYSGRVALRLPRSLHKQAAECALFEKTSLNQFLVAAAAERVGASKMYAAYACRFQAQWAATVTMSNVSIITLDAKTPLLLTEAIGGGTLVTTPASATAIMMKGVPGTQHLQIEEGR